MHPSSSSWERGWGSAGPGGPSWPLHTWAGQGPAGPGPATSGASVGSLGLAPTSNFTHFWFDRSLTPPFTCDCAPTFVNISKQIHNAILTQTFRDCSPQKINWFSGVPNSLGGVGQCLMNGVPGLGRGQRATILAQNSLLISCRGEKTPVAGKKFRDSTGERGEFNFTQTLQYLVSCGKINYSTTSSQSSVDAIAKQ